ncbi:hypothetical protein BJ684DRAFT_18291 [Piptocephalis cylindrospora]|uniref:DUF7082 domain-containing protein n=1 Tax=Piptocephalis cylindrospora TaxID=1907219 RepID=A0A4V1IYQ6_9FUNG|nr:hypothetical protein BJ684DRAFT_18291 [Piptocephalis cylindrospora]|eukprot:RKP15389.1 hypothetical protein BJ684DRAFT_18291 [Piptocephalis cylindrospora]
MLNTGNPVSPMQLNPNFLDANIPGTIPAQSVSSSSPSFSSSSSSSTHTSRKSPSHTMSLDPSHHHPLTSPHGRGGDEHGSGSHHPSQQHPTRSIAPASTSGNTIPSDSQAPTALPIHFPQVKDIPSSLVSGANSAAAFGLNPYPTYLNKANLTFAGDLDDMRLNWSQEERQTQSRLVQFWRQIDLNTIRCSFSPVTQVERSPDARVEKNRIRRNLEGFRPLTVSKSRPECSTFFRLLMGFPAPKPRNIEKDVKVFHWRVLGSALKKIIGKYTASYSSTRSLDVVGSMGSGSSGTQVSGTVRDGAVKVKQEGTGTPPSGLIDPPGPSRIKSVTPPDQIPLQTPPPPPPRAASTGRRGSIGKIPSHSRGLSGGGPHHLPSTTRATAATPGHVRSSSALSGEGGMAGSLQLQIPDMSMPGSGLTSQTPQGYHPYPKGRRHSQPVISPYRADAGVSGMGGGGTQGWFKSGGGMDLSHGTMADTGQGGNLSVQSNSGLVTPIAATQMVDPNSSGSTGLPYDVDLASLVSNLNMSPEDLQRLLSLQTDNFMLGSSPAVPQQTGSGEIHPDSSSAANSGLYPGEVMSSSSSSAHTSGPYLTDQSALASSNPLGLPSYRAGMSNGGGMYGRRHSVAEPYPMQHRRSTMVARQDLVEEVEEEEEEGRGGQISGMLGDDERMNLMLQGLANGSSTASSASSSGMDPSFDSILQNPYPQSGGKHAPDTSNISDSLMMFSPGAATDISSSLGHIEDPNKPSSSSQYPLSPLGEEDV